MSVIRVVSYNIHKGRSPLGRRDSLYDLRLALYGLRPDLVFLQEVQGRNEQYQLLHAQHESLAAGLHMSAAYGRNAVRRRTDHGNALLSRFPILDYENQDISDHPLEQRGMLHARVEIGGQQVHCFVVHLGLFAGSRMRQVAALTDRISRLVPAQAPLLIAGDFNDWKDRLAPMFVRQLGVYEVFAYAPRGMGYSYAIRGQGLGGQGLRESLRRLRAAMRGGVAEQRDPAPVEGGQRGVEAVQVRADQPVRRRRRDQLGDRVGPAGQLRHRARHGDRVGNAGCGSHLVEELVGDISDEHDVEEPILGPLAPAPGVEGLHGNDVGGHEVTVVGGPRTWLVDGVLREDELAEITGFRLPEGPYETLAGFLMARLGHIPEPGETVTEGDWEFTVVEVQRRRVEQVRVVAPERDPSEESL